MLQRLRQLRQEKGISQQKLADVLMISQPAINKYENHNVEPDISLLKQIAAYFGTSIDYLVGYSDERNSRLAAVQPKLTEEEAQLMENYRSLTLTERESISMVIHNYLMARKR